MRRFFVVAVCVAPVLFTVSAPLRRVVEVGRALERFEHGAPRVARREHVVDGVRVRDFGAGPALVLVHGAHEEGIDEPRLVRLAEVLAAEGFGVRTPELPGLVALRLEPSDLDALRRASPPGAAAVGVSVGGTYVLRIAAETPSAFSALLTLGAPADLERTARAHLGEDAHPYARQVFASALGGVLDEQAVAGARARLARLSPAGHLVRVQAPVFLLHGAEDPLVSAGEVEALRRELPRSRHLVSVLLGHAETRNVGLVDRFALARFFAEAFEAFRRSPVEVVVY